MRHNERHAPNIPIMRHSLLMEFKVGTTASSGEIHSAFTPVFSDAGLRACSHLYLVIGIRWCGGGIIFQECRYRLPEQPAANRELGVDRSVT